MRTEVAICHMSYVIVIYVITNFKYTRDWIFCQFFYAALAIVLAPKPAQIFVLGGCNPPPPPLHPHSPAYESIRLLTLYAWILGWIRFVSFWMSVQNDVIATTTLFCYSWRTQRKTFKKVPSMVAKLTNIKDQSENHRKVSITAHSKVTTTLHYL